MIYLILYLLGIHILNKLGLLLIRASKSKINIKVELMLNLKILINLN